MRKGNPTARARWHHFGLIGRVRWATSALKAVTQSPTTTPEQKRAAHAIFRDLEALRIDLSRERVTAFDETF